MQQEKIVLFDIDYTIFDTDLFKKTLLQEYAVYSEVHPTLSRLHEIAELGIFSEGDLLLQKKKLKKTAVDGYFRKEHIHIVPYNNKNESMKHILARYRGKGKLYFVDDKLTSLFLAKQFMPEIVAIWIKRGVYALKQQAIANFVPDATVERLDQILPKIVE